MAYRDYSGGQSPDKTTGNILNKHKDGMPADAVYIGRGSKWGNPFTHIQGIPNTVLCKDRDEACDKHRLHLWQQIKQGDITLAELAALHGKDLVCFCAPLRCHGNTLQRAAAWAFTQLIK